MRADQITCATIVAVWHAHHRGVDVGADLDRIARAARSSTRSRASVAALRATLGTRDHAEWAAWWDLICGWSWGFPPHPALLPPHPTESASGIAGE